MKHPKSLFIVCIIGVVLVCCRFVEINLHKNTPLKVTSWDAFGYYMYNPAVFIYQDYKELKWLDTIDKKYSVTGGDGWQAQKADNGNYVFKYLGGVAIMQLPFFFIGHAVAKYGGYPTDGFSAPYQYALVFGALLYCFLGLLILRKVLLRYFNDLTTALTLLLLTLASNLVQYAAVDSSMSHIYIFFLFAAVLFSTIKWHGKPAIGWAFVIGYVIGLATMSRPTEAIMLFIPLLWDTHNKIAAKQKWALVSQHKSHLLIIFLGGLAGILPQLLYWKSTTGSFMYDVGSKWVFFNPFFRVLFGWEKGWFIYTPVAILFVLGLFFIKQYPFRRSVFWFCLLNIWIIIAWDDWLYGGGYSTRALVQSYPVFALALAALIEKIVSSKWKLVFYLLTAYLIFVNLFQFWQFNTGILHYREMNRRYYRHIYLNPNPSPLDMSLLDTREWRHDENTKYDKVIVDKQTSIVAHATPTAPFILLDTAMQIWYSLHWGQGMKVEATINTQGDYWGKRLSAEIIVGDSVKKTSVRLFQPVGERTHQYAFYILMPYTGLHEFRLKVYIQSEHEFNGSVDKLRITQF